MREERRDGGGSETGSLQQRDQNLSVKNKHSKKTTREKEGKKNIPVKRGRKETPKKKAEGRLCAHETGSPTKKKQLNGHLWETKKHLGQREEKMGKVKHSGLVRDPGDLLIAQGGK